MSYSRTEEKNDKSNDTLFFITKEDSDKYLEGTESTSQEEAYDPETGKINWDCPCIAGMTKPPCGEDFKAAFSCFVYSQAEPKGADCIEQFRKMQSCFEEHPEIYAQEMGKDEEDFDSKQNDEKNSDSISKSMLSDSKS